MPTVEELKASLKDTKPIGPAIPDFQNPRLSEEKGSTLLELIAQERECTIIETGSPIGSSMRSLAQAAGIEISLDELVTEVTSSKQGVERQEKFIRHQQIRRAPINPESRQEGPKLSGHEAFFIEEPLFGHYSDDENAIGLVIALEGLTLQKGQPEKIPELLEIVSSQEYITSPTGEKIYDAAPLQKFLHELLNTDDDEIMCRLQSSGFQQLSLDELRTVNHHLGIILAAEQKHMGSGEIKPGEPGYKPIGDNATDYRERLLQGVQNLPLELRRIYYFERGSDIRMLYAVPKIQEQIASLHAPSITKMAEIARLLDLPLQQEYIGILHEIMKLTSRGIEPVTRYILEYKKE